MAKKSGKGRKAAKSQNERKAGAADAFIAEVKASLGRPRSLIESDELIAKIKAAASAQLTQEQAAAILGVSHVTFGKFLKENERSRDAWESGFEYGKGSLRLLQLKTARGQGAQAARMQIWLGINWLGQTNRIGHTGPNGGPIQTLNGQMTEQQAADAYAAAINGGP